MISPVRAVALRHYLRSAEEKRRRTPDRTGSSSPYNGIMSLCFNTNTNEHDPIKRNLSSAFEEASQDEALKDKYEHLSNEYIKLTKQNMEIHDRNSSLEKKCRRLRLRLALEKLKQSSPRTIKEKKEKARAIVEREIESYEYEWMRDVFRPRSDSNISERECSVDIIDEEADRKVEDSKNQEEEEEERIPTDSSSSQHYQLDKSLPEKQTSIFDVTFPSSSEEVHDMPS